MTRKNPEIGPKQDDLFGGKSRQFVPLEKMDEYEILALKPDQVRLDEWEILDSDVCDAILKNDEAAWHRVWNAIAPTK